MGTRWDVQSHEDKYSSGIPDLSFGIGGHNGWIELKQVDKYGKGDNPIIKPKKYTPIQVNWINKRLKYAKNSCFVFVKVENDYYLFEGGFAKKIAEGQTRAWYRVMSTHWYEGRIYPDHLASLLIKELGAPHA